MRKLLILFIVSICTSCSLFIEDDSITIAPSFYDTTYEIDNPPCTEDVWGNPIQNPYVFTSMKIRQYSTGKITVYINAATRSTFLEYGSGNWIIARKIDLTTSWTDYSVELLDAIYIFRLQPDMTVDWISRIRRTD